MTCIDDEEPTWLAEDLCDCGAELDQNGRCWYCDRAWIWTAP